MCSRCRFLHDDWVCERAAAWCEQDRLDTLASVREAGISVCAGGIIGMGEGTMDRVGLLHQLATLPEHPESVPINALVAVKGTPLQVCSVPSQNFTLQCQNCAQADTLQM